MAYATWNPADKFASIGLSNGNLTATGTGGTWGAVRALYPKTTGKYYWEITVDATQNNWLLVGVGNVTGNLTGWWGDDQVNWAGLQSNIGLVWGPSAVPGNYTYDDPNIIGVAMDAGAGKAWLAINNSWIASGDPAAGTNPSCSGLSGAQYAALNLYSQASVSATANFGATAFTYAAPAGFGDGINSETDVTIAEAFTQADTTDGQSNTGVIAEAFTQADAVDGQRNVGEMAEAFTQSDSIDGQRNVGETAEDFTQADVVGTQITYETPAIAEDFTQADTTDGQRNVGENDEDFTQADTADRYMITTQATPEAFTQADACDGFNFTEWLAENEDRIIRTYECILTGAADSVADVTIPIASFQSRLEDGTPSFLSVVIPDTSYSSAINARSNGQIIVEMIATVDGAEALREEIARVDLEAIRIDDGSRNKSITIWGHLSVSVSGAVIALEAVTYELLSEGKYSFRCAYPDWYLKPGHTATYGSTSITVGQITHIVGNKNASMYVAEA